MNRLVSSGSIESSSGSSQDNGVEIRKKRQQTIVACNACRKRKSKCDGQRPICSACSVKKSSCGWTADPDAPPIVALKRKYDTLREQTRDMSDLVELMRTRPEDEAQDALRWLRASNDLGSALHSFRVGYPGLKSSGHGYCHSFNRVEETNSSLVLGSEHRSAPDHHEESMCPTGAVAPDSGARSNSSGVNSCASTAAGRVSIQNLLNAGSTIPEHRAVRIGGGSCGREGPPVPRLSLRVDSHSPESRYGELFPRISAQLPDPRTYRSLKGWTTHAEKYGLMGPS